MFIHQLMQGAMQLFYPHTCMGCGSDLLPAKSLLCLRCLSDLPHTHFAHHENNPVEKIFIGRISITSAHAEFYFTKNELVQTLIHQLKYKGNQEIGVYLGEMLGATLLASGRFTGIDYLVPLPLFAEKEHKRGYNQAEVICRGVRRTMNVPILQGNLIRQRQTETQTRKHRTERWQNVDGSFHLKNADMIKGKSLLLVDDVLTTGATLEACGSVLLQSKGVKLSLAVIAQASK